MVDYVILTTDDQERYIVPRQFTDDLQLPDVTEEVIYLDDLVGQSVTVPYPYSAGEELLEEEAVAVVTTSESSPAIEDLIVHLNSRFYHAYDCVMALSKSSVTTWLETLTYTPEIYEEAQIHGEAQIHPNSIITKYDLGTLHLTTTTVPSRAELDLVKKICTFIQGTLKFNPEGPEGLSIYAPLLLDDSVAGVNKLLRKQVLEMIGDWQLLFAMESYAASHQEFKPELLLELNTITPNQAATYYVKSEVDSALMNYFAGLPLTALDGLNVDVTGAILLLCGRDVDREYVDSYLPPFFTEATTPASPNDFLKNVVSNGQFSIKQHPGGTYTLRQGEDSFNFSLTAGLSLVLAVDPDGEAVLDSDILEAVRVYYPGAKLEVFNQELSLITGTWRDIEIRRLSRLEILQSTFASGRGWIRDGIVTVSPSCLQALKVIQDVYLFEAIDNLERKCAKQACAGVLFLNYEGRTPDNDEHQDHINIFLELGLSDIKKFWPANAMEDHREE